MRIINNNHYCNLTSKFHVRRTKEEKEKLLDYLEKEMSKLGWQTEKIVGRARKSFYPHKLNTNLITTTSSNPSIIIMAHYDTAKTIPKLFELIYKLFGRNLGEYIANSIALVVGIIAHYFGLWIALLFIAYIFILPCKNPVNYNDNTSGILTLLMIADKLNNDKINKNKILFAFTDNEEYQLLGSKVLRDFFKKNEFDLTNTKIINIDCVGNGEQLMFGYTGNQSKKNANEFKEFAEKEFNIKNTILCKATSSDHKVFINEGAIHIAYVGLPKFPVEGYYCVNAHRPDDNILELDKVEIVANLVSSYLNTSTNG